MTSLSHEISGARKSFGAVVGFTIRMFGVLSLLLLAVLVQVAAEKYYDPEHRLDAPQQFLSP